jgi:hypothetical protein
LSGILLYFDEDAMPRKVVVGLRSLGIDVATTTQVGNTSCNDEEQLAFATSQG